MKKRILAISLASVFVFSSLAFSLPTKRTLDPATEQAMQTMRQENKATHDQMKQLHKQLMTTKDPAQRKALMAQMKDLRKQQRIKMHDFTKTMFMSRTHHKGQK